MIRRLVAFVLAAAGLLSLATAPASAQASCRQATVVTTRTAGGFALTPLDAIAFAGQPAPASVTIVRQITICPSGSVPVLPVVPPVSVIPSVPAIAPFPLVIVTPGSVLDETTTPPSPAPAPSSVAPRPPAPAIVGTVPVDTVQDLAQRSAQYDRMVVTVSGTVAGVEQREDARGTPLTAVRLEAQGASIGVLVWGHSALRAGDRVRVTGPFYVSTPFAGPAGVPWHNVIEAQVLAR